MDNIVEQVEQAKKLNLEWPFDEQQITNQLPSGWKKLALIIYNTAKKLDGKIIRMYYKMGVLKVEMVSDDEDMQIALNMLSSAIAMRSSLTCMISGVYGKRRKSYDGWPCLSGEIFIQYSNQLPYEEESKKCLTK